MKNYLCSMVGAVGSYLAYLVGGWDNSIRTLLLFMLIDYVMGLIVAGVFKKSLKTESGALESRAGWKGLCKKGITLMFVIVGTRLDMEIGTTYIRDGICIAFIVNELISIVENAGLMGLPIPSIVTKAIEVLRQKEESTHA